MSKDLLQKRYLVIAEDTSGDFKIGTVIYEDHGRLFKKPAEFSKYPHLFRELQWWEMRSIDELLSVKYAKVIAYTGYWIVGDVVPIIDYDVVTNPKPYVKDYVLKYNHKVHLNTVEPATETEYNNYIKSLKQTV